MMLGIFAKTFSRPRLEGVLDAVAGHGLGCVQFNFACAGLATLPERIAPKLVTRIRDAMNARGLAIAAVSGTFNMIDPDLGKRRAGLARLRILASVCGQLGAPVVTLCTGTRDPNDMWRRHRENDSREAWRDLAASLETALAGAEEWNVTLGVEPEINNVVNSAKIARRLLDEMRSPRLKIVMDAANLFEPGETTEMKTRLQEAFDLLGRDLVVAHAKELNRDGHAGGLALGRGILDWDQYLAMLARAGYDGSIIVHGVAENEVADSVAFLRDKMALPLKPRPARVRPANPSEHKGTGIRWDSNGN